MTNDLSIILKPTDELYEQEINGVSVPVRVWSGQTNNGTKIEAFILSVTPESESDFVKFKSELPFFMVKSSQLYSVGDKEKDKTN